jgi:Protein of unknown function (DUF1348)
MTPVTGIAVAAMWEFDQDGYMRRREASINDVPIGESRRASSVRGSFAVRAGLIDVAEPLAGSSVYVQIEGFISW